MILLTYLLHAYPEGIKASRMVDPLVKSIMEDVMPLIYPLVAKVTKRLETYSQEDEKSTANLKGEWHSVNRPDKVMNVILVE